MQLRVHVEVSDQIKTTNAKTYDGKKSDRLWGERLFFNSVYNHNDQIKIKVMDHSPMKP